MSRSLATLIDQALAGSPTVHEAQARLRAARASLSASRTQLAADRRRHGARGASVRVPKNALSGLAGRPAPE